MFETSVIRARSVAAPRRIGFLSASIGFHSFAALAAVVLSVQATSFPTNAPNQFAVLLPSVPIVIPPPLGTPDAKPKPPAPQPQSTLQQQPAVPRDAAPNIIPNAVPTVPSNASTDTSGPGSGAPSGPSDVGIGVPWGDPKTP